MIRCLATIGLLLLIVGEISLSYSQQSGLSQNLIKNHSFENGSASPPCDDGTHSSNLDRYDEFDEIVDYWNIADFSNCGLFTNCLYPQPIWEGAPTCFPIVGSHKNRYVKMRDHKDTQGADYRDAIRQSMNDQLYPGESYIFRIRLREFSPLVAVLDENWSSNNIRIHFTELGKHWYRDFNNNRWTDAISLSIPKGSNGWHSLQCSFTVPEGEDYQNLNNIIIAMEDGFLYIDRVELYKEPCESYLFIENREYHLFNHPFSSSNVIHAGNSVNPNTSNGDVVIKDGGIVEYHAEQKIVLKSGFRALNSSVFKAKIIDNCSKPYECYSSKKNIDSEKNKPKKKKADFSHNEFRDFRVFPNPAKRAINVLFAPDMENKEELKDGMGKFLLIDSQGRVVSNNEFSFVEFMSGIKIPLRNLDEGIYMGKLIDKRNSKLLGRKKIVVE